MRESEIIAKFERIVVSILMVMMALVVVLAVIELAWLLIKDIITPPILILEVDELLDIFGAFLLVLIGLELLDTIQHYYADRIIRVEVVVVVAIIAVARKAIIIDYTELTSFTLLDVGLVILAFSIGYFILKRSHRWEHSHDDEE